MRPIWTFQLLLSAASAIVLAGSGCGQSGINILHDGAAGAGAPASTGGSLLGSGGSAGKQSSAGALAGSVTSAGGSSGTATGGAGGTGGAGAIASGGAGATTTAGGTASGGAGGTAGASGTGGAATAGVGVAGATAHGDAGAIASGGATAITLGTASGGAGGTAGASGTGGSAKVCNATSTPGCKAQLPEGCGDGKNNQNGIEQCDDGNGLPGDGCNGACRVEPHWTCPPAGVCVRNVVCSDSIIGPGEVCDDGNTLDNDGCNSTCTVQNPAYKCIVGQPCTRISQCGNKRIEPGEQCDDGNSQSGDGCSSSCQLESGWVCPAPGKACQQAPKGCQPNCKPGDCGNAMVDATEACDDGVNNGAYGTCNPDCTPAPRGGDGVVQLEYGEECEPTMSNDPNCTNACRMPGGCGDGKIEPPEQCDDGASFNNSEYGGCTPSCVFALHCGDSGKQTRAMRRRYQ